MSPTTEPIPHEWLSVTEVTQLLRTTRSKILSWIYDGQLHAVNIAADPNARNARWRVSRAGLEEFLACRANQVEGGNDAA
jgi:hypothetical protein